LLLLATGCATRPPLAVAPPDPATEQRARQALRAACPSGVRLTQRATVTAAGRRFSCDGLVQVGADGELRVALLAPLGVLAEVRVTATGEVRVVKTAPSFRPAWARRYVATTARWLFAPDEPALRFGRLADGRAALWRVDAPGSCRVYAFSADGSRWEELTVTDRGRRQCRAVRRAAGAFHVATPGCTIELRTVAP
jgi:hypothetical protein